MNQTNLQFKTLLLLLGLVTIAFIWILLPFYGAVFWAVILGIIFAPMQRRLQQGVRLDVLGGGVGFGFGQHTAQGGEHLLEDRDGGGVQGNSHGSLWVMSRFEPAAIIDMPGACLLFFPAYASELTA
jgi:hypothetical protein